MRGMDARRRRVKSAVAFILFSTLTSSLGCNPLGWGISQVKSLIHHHAHKPIVRDLDESPPSQPLRAPAETKAENSTA